MLPKAHRLTNSEDFRRTVRSGQRSVTPTVVVHSAFDGGDDPARGITMGDSCPACCRGAGLRRGSFTGNRCAGGD